MDYNSKYLDHREKILDARIKAVYIKAKKELEKSLADFVAQKDRMSKAKKALVDAGKMSEAEYKEWLKRAVFRQQQWEQKVEHCTRMISESNAKALAIIRREQYNVYTEGANHQAYEVENRAHFQPDISFEIYDMETVERLIEEKPALLPPKQINGKKDRAWNQGIISNCVTEGIIQGESIDKIAARIARETQRQNDSSMRRYARTALTAAQNAGRIDTMKRTQDMGVHVKKKWLATLDRKTRHSHQLLDGQEEEINRPFMSIFGKIMYPGDPEAHPGDVYNCRCTLEYVYPDFADLADDDVERRDNESGEVIDDMTYTEWLNRNSGSRKQTQARKRMDTSETNSDWDSLSYEEKRKAFDGGDELIAKEREERDEIEKTLKDLNHENSQLRREKMSINRRISELEEDNSEAAQKERTSLESRLKAIEKRRAEILEEYSRTYDRTVAYNSSEIVGRAEEHGVQYKLPNKDATPKTIDEIVERIAGGDMTEGSCASAAMCYVGQKEGYDVCDFRGGASRKIVSEDARRMLKAIGEETGYHAIEAHIGYGTEPAIDLISKCERGKEYYLCAGRHASIVRTNSGGEFEYLELQSGGINGWKKAPIGADGKQDIEGLFGVRFGCDTKEYDIPIMLETEGMYGSKLFHRILGYINTSADDQLKGAGGFER